MTPALSPPTLAPETAPAADLDLAVCTSLLEGLADAAWLVDLHSATVVAANGAAHQLFRCAPQGLLGEPAAGLAASPEDLVWWTEAAAGQFAPLHSDTVVATPDGRALHVSRSIRPVHLRAGDGGSALHALVVLSDRSAEQRAEAQREELLAELPATLESTADGILVTDLGGRVRAFNRRFADLWGMPVSLLQQHDDAAVQAWMARSLADPVAYGQRLQALAQATLISANDRLELVTGQVLERVTRPLFSGGRPQGRVWSFRDLTE
ncbi:MAG: PAS domain-containing protein, partial [Rubrivivax sp.]|nr:PAS domain-containing protein [Rubrivivax sp.]